MKENKRITNNKKKTKKKQTKKKRKKNTFLYKIDHFCVVPY